ncbi:hypothetical protein WJ967_23135 [Achromobacter xylosoxidans]
MRLPRLSKRAGLALACAASALVFGSAVLPARWLLALQPDDAPLVLADAAGTLWNGAAWIALGPPGARRMLPQPLHWQWRWSSLTLELSHPWLQGPLRAGLGWDGVAVSAQSLRLPATVLPALGAPWNTLAPEGTLEISWQALRLGAALPQAPWPSCAGAMRPPPCRRWRPWAPMCCGCAATAAPAPRWRSAPTAARWRSPARAASTPVACASRARPPCRRRHRGRTRRARRPHVRAGAAQRRHGGLRHRQIAPG